VIRENKKKLGMCIINSEENLCDVNPCNKKRECKKNKYFWEIKVYHFALATNIEEYAVTQLIRFFEK
jgi:hypothetical protein